MQYNCKKTIFIKFYFLSFIYQQLFRSKQIHKQHSDSFPDEFYQVKLDNDDKNFPIDSNLPTFLDHVTTDNNQEEAKT